MWWAALLNSFAAVLDSGGAGGGGGSYESIATVSATGSNSTLTFSSIPSTYTHLQIRGIARAASGGETEPFDLRLYFNGLTTGIYSSHALYGNGTSAAATAAHAGSDNYIYTHTGLAGSGMTGTSYNACIIDIQDYASTTKNKTSRYFGGADNNGATGIIALSSGLFISTAAITSVSINSQYYNFTSGTTFALYGIKGA
jgi:hypothetical protein